MRTALFITNTLKIGDPSIDYVVEVLHGRYDVRFLDTSSNIQQQMHNVNIVVDWQANPPTSLLKFADQIKLWQILCGGNEKFDFDWWKSKPTRIETCPSSTSGHALGEAALMMALMLLRRTSESRTSITQQRLSFPTGEELGGKHLLIYGFGESGRALAKFVRPFGVEVRTIEIQPIPALELEKYGILVPSYSPSMLQEVISWCDILSIHVPLTPNTRHSINKAVFQNMKSGSFLINVSRGGIVDEVDLLEALDSGVLAGAALDVFNSEPLDPQHPILNHRNVVVTPHVAGNTPQTAVRRAEVLRTNLIKYGLY